MTEHEREIESNEMGKCPHCDSPNYIRTGLEPTDDIVTTHCNCNNCNKEFEETFVLKFQNWEQ